MTDNAKRSEPLLAALETLTARIGVYGKRNKNPLSIHWGNGIVLRDHTGLMITAGTEHVAKWIARHCKANANLDRSERIGESHDFCECGTRHDFDVPPGTEKTYACECGRLMCHRTVPND